MVGKTRKRTPEEIRTTAAKTTSRVGGRPQRQAPKSTKKSGVTGRPKKRSMSNKSVRTQGASRITRPQHRVASSTSTSVMFTLDAPSATDVSVAGSFNDWTPQTMTKGPGGLWRTTIQLAPGTYEYRLLVDAIWREDPNNPRKTQNDIDGYNSICGVM